MTRADKIRNLNDEELAKFIFSRSIMGAIQAKGVLDKQMIEEMTEELMHSEYAEKDMLMILEWLNQEDN